MAASGYHGAATESIIGGRARARIRPKARAPGIAVCQQNNGDV
jgi:hypothetical protein